MFRLLRCLGLIVFLVPVHALAQSTVAGLLSADSTRSSGFRYAAFRLVGSDDRPEIITRLQSSDFDTRLLVLTAAGPLQENDDSGGSTNSELALPGGAGREALVVVTSYAPGESGFYLLAAEGGNLVPEPAPLPSVLAVHLAEIGSGATAAASAEIDIEATASTAGDPEAGTGSGGYVANLPTVRRHYRYDRPIGGGGAPAASAGVPSDSTDSPTGGAAAPDLPGTAIARDGPARNGAADGDDSFPWPPPQPSALMELSRAQFPPLAAAATVGDVERLIRGSLDECGYSERRYYRVPNGFALVTRLEQIDADGRPLAGAMRWSVELPNLRALDFGLIMRALLSGREGYYRVVVLIVSDAFYVTRPDPVAGADAEAWFAGGTVRLRPEIAALSFSPGHAVTALIYEFERHESDELAIFRAPGRLAAGAHMRASGLWDGIGPAQ